MDAATISALFSGVAALIVALGTVYVMVLGARLKVMGETVQTLEKNTNSIKDALVAATDSAARAEGNIAGRKEQRAETRQDAPAAHSQPAPNDAVKIGDVVKIGAAETANETARGT